MIEQEELDQQQKLNVNKEKLMYTPPKLIDVFESTIEVKGGNRGVSEHICGCGIGS